MNRIGSVDMFPFTNVGYELVVSFPRARRDGSIDVTGKGLTAEKVPYFRAFLASDRRRQRAKIVAKNAPTEHIKGNVRQGPVSDLDNSGLWLWFECQRGNSGFREAIYGIYIIQ